MMPIWKTTGRWRRGVIVALGVYIGLYWVIMKPGVTAGDEDGRPVFRSASLFAPLIRAHTTCTIYFPGTNWLNYIYYPMDYVFRPHLYWVEDTQGQKLVREYGYPDEIVPEDVALNVSTIHVGQTVDEVDAILMPLSTSYRFTPSYRKGNFTKFYGMNRNYGRAVKFRSNGGRPPVVESIEPTVFFHYGPYGSDRFLIELIHQPPTAKLAPEHLWARNNQLKINILRWAQDIDDDQVRAAARELAEQVPNMSEKEQDDGIKSLYQSIEDHLAEAMEADAPPPSSCKSHY